jgi:hypothetical protein
MQAALPFERRKLSLLAASGRFGPFKPETDRVVRAVEVETNQAIETMKRAWFECSPPEPCNSGKSYVEMLGRIRTVACSAKDIGAFSLMLPAFEGEERFHAKAGLFLSALICNSKDEVFMIHTVNLIERIYNLGYDNDKKIIVEGDAGHNLGIGMKGGEIIVNGDAGNRIGGAMRGGSITINGDAGNDVGELMKAGSIYLNGGHLGICEHIYGGRIFHKGAQIWPKS